jgi:hypothetical protein
MQLIWFETGRSRRCPTPSKLVVRRVVLFAPGNFFRIITCRNARSGKVVARSGLRMMPTFPPPPLSTVRRVFPQYGWKVGFSGSAFPHVAQVKPAPSMPCASSRFASALRALRGLILGPALCRDDGLGDAPPFEELAPLPQRSSLRSGF